MDVRMKIYCIPGGGTPASVFFQWVPLLKGKATVRTLDYARTFSDQSTPSVQGIAAKLYEKIQAELDEAEDYMLLSSCTGTLIAYELYQQIAAHRKRLPQYVVAVSAFSPATAYYQGNRYLCAENRAHITGIYRALFDPSLFLDPDHSAQVCADWLLAQNQDPSLTATVLPPKTVLGASCTYEQEMMLQFANSTITMLTFDWYIASAYAFDADANRSIASKLVVLHGTEDALVSTADAKAWESLAAGEMQLIEIPGDHNIITNQTHACMEQILKLLS